MLKILHCVLDDKFIDSMIEVMDTFRDYSINDFVCLSQGDENAFTYIKKESRVKFIECDDFNDYLTLGCYDVVFIHSLFALQPKLIAKIPKKIKVVWIAWGYDLYEPIFYNRPLIRVNQLYHPFTRIVKNAVYLLNIKKVISDIFLRIRHPSLYDVWGRIDYFSGIIPIEYGMIVNNPKNSFFRAKKVEFNYFSLNSTCDEDHINSPYVDGDNIQIGNSGDPTNNHLDIMRTLRKLKLRGKKVYIPMSYGGSKMYLNIVRTYGQYLWKDNFIPLIDFLPIDDFLKIISTSRYMLFYHERQQAMGNIYTGLWNGCMVFVSETSPIYGYLKDLGFYIFSIQHDLQRIENGEKLSYVEMEHNRRIFIKNVSPVACLGKITKTLDVLSKACGN